MDGPEEHYANQNNKMLKSWVILFISGFSKLFLQLHPCLFPGLLYSLPLCYFLFHLIGQFIYFENPANYSSIVVWFEKGYPSIHVANILLQSLFQWRDEKAWIGTQWRGLWCNKWCPHSVSLVTGTKQWNRNTVFYFWFSIVIICTY